jgi:hypothetical protein
MRFPVVVSDSLGDLIEVPLLSSSILSPSSKPDVVGTVALSNSLHWKSGSDIERSVNVETVLFIETLSGLLSSLVKIFNLPFLLDLVVSVSNIWLSSFNRLWSGVNDESTIDVDKLFISVSELSPLSLYFTAVLVIMSGKQKLVALIDLF